MVVDLPDYARAIALPAVVTDPASCLGSTDVIDTEHPTIAAWVARVGKQPRALFMTVRDQVEYDLAPSLTTRASWLASATLERKTGFCQQKAVALAAVLRYAGIPAAIDFQHIRDHKLIEPKFAKVLPGGIIAFHGRVRAFIDDAWIVLDPSLDMMMCAARGYRVSGYGHPLPKTDTWGRPHFDELGTAGPFADLPKSVSDVALALGPMWKDLQTAKAGGASM